MSKIYDVIVLGAGPAGLAAGLYAGRSRLSVLIVEKGQDGGQISITDEIENYPGQVVDQPESGPSLIARSSDKIFSPSTFPTSSVAFSPGFFTFCSNSFSLPSIE